MQEVHKSSNAGWLRAAVLGANDGIVSTASLILGIAAAGSSRHEILLAGVAGLTAGAMSMACGEYVSVSSQADTENADLEREKAELEANPEFELEELTEIYVARGLDPDLARKVAQQLTAFDALGSHARDELGFTEELAAKPVQAAVASAAAFSVGAAMPIIMSLLAPENHVIPCVATASLVFLMILGLLAARVGGADHWKGALRVGFWGALAMAVTAGIGSLFGVN